MKLMKNIKNICPPPPPKKKNHERYNVLVPETTITVTFKG